VLLPGDCQSFPFELSLAEGVPPNHDGRGGFTVKGEPAPGTEKLTSSSFNTLSLSGGGRLVICHSR